MAQARVAALRDRWKRAVERARRWEDAPPA
jgi:hypothetical protein